MNQEERSRGCLLGLAVAMADLHVARSDPERTSSPISMPSNDSLRTARGPRTAQKNASMRVASSQESFAGRFSAGRRTKSSSISVSRPGILSRKDAKGRKDRKEMLSLSFQGNVSRRSLAEPTGKSPRRIFAGPATSSKASRLPCGPSHALRALRTRFSWPPISATTPIRRPRCAARSLEHTTASPVFRRAWLERLALRSEITRLADQLRVKTERNG